MSDLTSWIQREIGHKVMMASEQFPAIVLTGARQTGKTSLLRYLFPKYSYVSLDIPSIAVQAEEHLDDFLSLYPPPIIIDEVQYAPKVFRGLKMAIDNNRHKMGQFILTGSQKFSLMKEVSDSLAGRCAVLELGPLSCSELSSANLLNDQPASECVLEVEHLIRGYYPELWRNRNANTMLFYSSYLATYLERDVRQILKIGSLRDFDRFLRSCALRSGQLLNKTELAKDVGVTVNTIVQWLSVLESSNQITLLEPYFSNKRKQLVKSPKLYFNDPGILSFLLGLNGHTLLSYAGIGNIWETLIFAELLKLKENSLQSFSLWFYQEHKKSEIDFLVEIGGVVHGIEVKWGNAPTANQIAHFLKAFANLEELQATKWIACRTFLDKINDVENENKSEDVDINDVNVVHGFNLAKHLKKRLFLNKI